MNDFRQITSISLVIVLLIFLQQSCQENNNDKSLNRQYFPSGELQHVVSMKDSMLHGVSTTYYICGKKKYEKEFFEDIPVNHHYYYSESGNLLGYNFFDVKGELKYQYFLDTLTNYYIQDGKPFYVQRKFHENYSIGDSVCLIPVIANPFKSEYTVDLFFQEDRISKTYIYGETKSPLFLYFIKEGNNSLMIVGEMFDENSELFRRDTVTIDLGDQ